MIDLYNGELRDILPPYFKYKPEIIAYSAAIKVGAGFALEYAKRTLLFADVDSMPEYLLDYAAIELDAQYYNNADSIDIKRQYIKNALYWKIKAGTIEAVEELIRTAFGEGTVKIWKDFEKGPGTPGTFRIETSAGMTKDTLETFSALIENTKNESAHLETVTVNRKIDTEIKIAGEKVQDSEQYIANDINIDNPDTAYIYDAHAAIYDFAEGIENLILHAAVSEMNIESVCACASAIVQDSEQTIGG